MLALFFPILSIFEGPIDIYIQYLYIVPMSPRLAKLGNLEIWIYTRDHNPPHVHIKSPDVDTKIELGTWKVVYSRGLNAKSLKKLVEFLKSIESDLTEAWHEIHK